MGCVLGKELLLLLQDNRTSCCLVLLLLLKQELLLRHIIVGLLLLLRLLLNVHVWLLLLLQCLQACHLLPMPPSCHLAAIVRCALKHDIPSWLHISTSSCSTRHGHRKGSGHRHSTTSSSGKGSTADTWHQAPSKGLCLAVGGSSLVAAHSLALDTCCCCRLGL